jgi:hypothetical protein
MNALPIRPLPQVLWSIARIFEIVVTEISTAKANPLFSQSLTKLSNA